MSPEICRAPRCGKEIDSDKLFCPGHWVMLTASMKEAICMKAAECLRLPEGVSIPEEFVRLIRSAIRQISLREGATAPVKRSFPKVSGRTGE